MPTTKAAEYAHRELRKDAQIAAEVNAALSIAVIDGIGSAIEYMRHHEVDHLVAIRVLASPRSHRKHICDSANQQTH
jgi:tellurite resistance protein